MQGKPAIIDVLNETLTIELTAINQYFIHSRLCGHWGFTKLEEKLYKESIGEMKHADKLIQRILFLDGVPEIARYNPIRVGKDVPTVFANDLALEASGVANLNKGIALCLKENDGGSRELLEYILLGSEEHVDWLETQISAYQATGIQNFLAEHL